MKRIVITGVSRGLGAAMAEGFIERGHIVFGCARSARSLGTLADRHGSPHRFDAVDVADVGAVGAWAQCVLEDGGPPDVLVNNAALMNENAPLWRVPPDEFSAMIDVNIKGVFHVIRHFVPAMIEHGSGVIVNFSSGWGRATSADVAPYCATKWAIEGMTRALADELPRGMAAVPLNPGIIHTGMLDRCFGQQASNYPSPDAWAERAVPYILNLGPQDSGLPRDVPC